MKFVYHSMVFLLVFFSTGWGFECCSSVLSSSWDTMWYKYMMFDASLCLAPRQSTDVDHLIKVTDSNVRRDTERRIVQQTQHAIEIEALGADSHASQEWVAPLEQHRLLNDIVGRRLSANSSLKQDWAYYCDKSEIDKSIGTVRYSELYSLGIKAEEYWANSWLVRMRDVIFNAQFNYIGRNEEGHDVNMASRCGYM